mgnify:FL=1
MTARLHLPLLEPEDVVLHLGQQEKHWKAGRSAHALCTLWHRDGGLPQSVASILATQRLFDGVELIDAFLERQIDLGTAGRPSQTDLLAILGLKGQIAILAVEAKAGEPFGDRVAKWNDGSEGKKARLSALCQTLEIPEGQADSLRYQLLHRTASAIYEARRYRSKLAVMLVQSFAKDDESFADFAAFARAMGEAGDVKPAALSGPFNCEDVSLYIGWVDDHDTVDHDQSRCLQQLRNYAERLSAYCSRLRDWCDSRA